MSDTITLIGNIVAPPERRITATGLVITSFRLATNDRRFDRSTEAWVDGEANYFSISVFRALAENAFHSFHKGERVIVSGKLRVKKWETATTQGTTVEIDAESLGHDLLFGTTRFDRSPRRNADAEPAVGGADAWAVSVPADGGSIDADETGEDSFGAQSSPPRADEPALALVDTPF